MVREDRHHQKTRHPLAQELEVAFDNSHIDSSGDESQLSGERLPWL